MWEGVVESQQNSIEIENQFSDSKLKAIEILRLRSYRGNINDEEALLEEVSEFKHFEWLKGDERGKRLLCKCFDKLQYEHVPRGEFLFHQGDVGDKLYFIICGVASVLVLIPQKDIFKQEQSYQLRNYWSGQIDRPELSAYEREMAKQNYQRARKTIITFQDKYDHHKLWKMFAANSKDLKNQILGKYFHKEYQTIGYFRQAAELSENSAFGEAALIGQRLRTASIFAAQDLHLFSLRGRDYLEIFEPKQVRNLNYVLKNLERALSGLTKKQLLNLSYLFEREPVAYNLNQIVFKEDQERQFIYLIRSGAVAFKSSRGIGLGIIGEGEFFGCENKKPKALRVLLADKHLFNAQCSATNTLLYRLETKLLEPEEFDQGLKEFAVMGAQKAEYYAKRAQHCQNIFQQIDIQGSDREIELSSALNGENNLPATLTLQKSMHSHNMKQLMNKIQIQKKFQQYVKQDENHSDDIIDQHQQQTIGNNTNTVPPEDQIMKPINKQFDSKASSLSSLNSEFFVNQKMIPQTSYQEINTIPEGTRSLASLSAFGIESNEYLSAHSNGHLQFQFIPKSEFESTKNSLILQLEKQKQRKPQLFLPQEVQELPLSKMIAKKLAPKMQQIQQYHTNQQEERNHSSNSIPNQNIGVFPSTQPHHSSLHFHQGVSLPSSALFGRNNQKLQNSIFSNKSQYIQFKDRQRIFSNSEKTKSLVSPQMIGIQATQIQISPLIHFPPPLPSVDPSNIFSLSKELPQTTRQRQHDKEVSQIQGGGVDLKNIQFLNQNPKIKKQINLNTFDIPIKLENEISSPTLREFTNRSSFNNEELRSKYQTSQPISSHFPDPRLTRNSQTQEQGKRINESKQKDDLNGISTVNTSFEPNKIMKIMFASNPVSAVSSPFNSSSQKNSLNSSNNDQRKVFSRTSVDFKAFPWGFIPSCRENSSEKKLQVQMAITDLSCPENNKPSLCSRRGSITLAVKTQKIKRKNNSAASSPERELLQKKNGSIKQNPLYSSLFRKSNESRSLQKKIKMMPFFVADQELQVKFMESTSRSQSPQNELTKSDAKPKHETLMKGVTQFKLKNNIKPKSSGPEELINSSILIIEKCVQQQQLFTLNSNNKSQKTSSTNFHSSSGNLKYEEEGSRHSKQQSSEFQTSMHLPFSSRI